MIKAIKTKDVNDCVGCCFHDLSGCAILNNMVDQKYLDEVDKLPSCSNSYIYKEVEHSLNPNHLHI
jgi:hypothetical protein